MNTRLVGLLGEAKVQQWRQTPIKEWHGFTVEDMESYGLRTRVLTWFNKLTDKEILAIAKKKPLSLESSAH